MTFKFDAYGPAFFENVTVSFKSGHLYFVQGKNGVGKSTFFSILQNTIPHNASLIGTIELDNKVFEITNNTMPHAISSQVKTVVQDINKMIVTTLTVKENMQLALLPSHPGLNLLSSHITLPTIMYTFGIDLITEVYKLSGGQKQILAIMMALQKPTQILLLDEPTAALDDKNTNVVMKFLTKLAQEKNIIIIIITHDKELLHTYTHNGSITITKQETVTTRNIQQN